MDEKEVELNGQKLNESQFQEKKEKVESMPQASIVEVAPNVFKTRLRD